MNVTQTTKLIKEQKTTLHHWRVKRHTTKRIFTKDLAYWTVSGEPINPLGKNMNAASIVRDAPRTFSFERRKHAIDYFGRQIKWDNDPDRNLPTGLRKSGETTSTLEWMPEKEGVGSVADVYVEREQTIKNAGFYRVEYFPNGTGDITTPVWICSVEKFPSQTGRREWLTLEVGTAENKADARKLAQTDYDDECGAAGF